MSDILLQPVQDNNIEKTLTIYQKYNYLINKKISLYRVIIILQRMI